MLEATVRSIGRRPRKTEMVVSGTSDKVTRRGRLRDQLRALHSLAIPKGCVVNSNLHALGDRSIGRIRVGSIDIDVVSDVAGTVDVILVGTDLVGPGP